MAGLVLSHFSPLSFGWSFLVAAAAILINGLVAQVEDQSPGGLEAPKIEEERASSPRGDA
jgi:hypothetical protein